MAKNDIGELANQLYQSLKELDPEDRNKVITAALALLGDNSINSSNSLVNTSKPKIRNIDPREPTFLNRVDITPKQFLREKEPKTDIESV